METVPHAVDPNRAAQHGSVVMRLLDELFPLVEGFYVDLHKNPELSHSEQRTASGVAEWLTQTGYEVHTGVGGTGVVGILRNGPGPTVMLRADMDALPLEERTGLPYASTTRAQDADGAEVPVMHACGHDAHTACLVGAADLLSETREEWSGTVMIVAQPAEETLDGARTMLDDGLFERFGRPDVILAQHLGPQPAGLISHRAGVILGAARSYRVRVYGEGGHASAPHTTVDPVLIAANIVTRLQSVVSREVSPAETAVLTVGRIQAGTKANIIPDEAFLEINTRALNEGVITQLEEAIGRIVRAEAAASGATREPEVEPFQKVGVTHNDAASTQAVGAAHLAYFGEDYVIYLPDPSTGSEDFGCFGLPDDPHPIPYVLWFVGATPHDVWEAAPGDSPYEKMAHVPGPHSPFFAPAREPALRAGLAAITVAALSYLGSDERSTVAPLGAPVPEEAPLGGPTTARPSVAAAGVPVAPPAEETPSAGLSAPPPEDSGGPFPGPPPVDAPVGGAFPGPPPEETGDPFPGPPPVNAPVGGAFPGPPPGNAPEPSAPRPEYGERSSGPGPDSPTSFTGPSAPSAHEGGNDAYDSAFLASSWDDPSEEHPVHATHDADMRSVMNAQDDEWRSEKAEESTQSADMAAFLDEDPLQGPPPVQGPPSGPAFSGPPPRGGAHDAPPPQGPDDDRPDSEYRL
ncbi:amidohydrolase [Nocardiopsis sp. EMB25]|uniref:amidohydrolase n=1 Tax=Nocardiopsis sp. EMB25 TaxID=2835867 RepID=UPI002284493B|nr:amidohydrolase [Nocardiopsis sp. EMB25]MCY9787888.1 amidohydrolase [Nocardiopsis sp. EMB25]